MSTDFEIRERALELMNRLSENFGEVTEEDDAELTAILDEVESPMAYLFFMQKKCEANAAECKELADIYKPNTTLHISPFKIAANGCFF